jgi:Bifunctional DNA primase/polymerase, N-terminal
VTPRAEVLGNKPVGGEKGLCQLSRQEGEAGNVDHSDLVYAATMISGSVSAHATFIFAGTACRLVPLSGGLQLYFTHAFTAAKGNNALGPGIDLKSDGGLVVAPPSIHPNGNAYAWEISSPIRR